MSDNEKDPSVPNQIELPKDRELALHEVNSILTGLQSRYADMHVYSKKAFARDRIIGWSILAFLIAVLGWVLFYQYASAQELRRSLYESCVILVQRDETTKSLYRQIAVTTPDPVVKQALLNAANSIESRDCEARYLNN